MLSVLGIDAAWTDKHPSGVALVEETSNGWRLVCVESSYERFHLPVPNDRAIDVPSVGSLPDVQAILDACTLRLGRSVTLVAIDMPLSRTAIIGRRESDNAVSRCYGGRKCGTHSPSRASPGRISDNLRSSFERAGYKLQTSVPVHRGLIEVYPHPALVELANASERLKYKYARRGKLWPDLSPSERLASLRAQWRLIVLLLDSKINGVAGRLPALDQGASGVQMKAYEDAIDAVVCAWVGICTLEGRAVRYGDNTSAIWIPKPCG